MSGTAAAGAALASNMAAPAILAQTRAPIKLGNLNTYTGGLAYAGEDNFNAMNLYFDSINWTIAGRKVEIIKEDDQFNPQVGLQKAKKLVESDKVDVADRRPGEQRRARGAQLHEAAKGVLRGVRRRHRRHHLGPLSLSVPHLDLDLSAHRRRWRTTSTTSSARRSSPRRPTTPAAATSWRSSRGRIVAKGGKVLKEIWPPLGTTDFSAYLTDIKSINPPVTYDFMPGADAVRFIQQYSEFGLKEKMPLTGFTMIDSQTISALGKAAVGVISALTFVDTLDNPESKKFVADYQAKYKSSPDLFADYGYVGAQRARRSA